MTCPVCPYGHSPVNFVGANTKEATKEAQAKRNMRTACRMAEACVEALCKKNNTPFHPFYFEDECVKIEWRGVKMAILACTGIEKGELMKIEDIQKKILKSYIDSVTPVALDMN